MHQLKNLPPTPAETLEKAFNIAKSTGLKYVYVGNIPGHRYNSTYCPECGHLLIERVGYQIIQNTIKDGHCPACNETIPGIWN